MGKRLGLVLAGILGALFLSPALSGGALPGPTAVRYRILDLGFLPGTDSATPWAMNETGAVVGTAGSTPYRAFLWTESGGMVELPCPFTNCVPRDLNDRGQVVGSGWNATIEWPGTAIRWTNGTPDLLGTLPNATTSEAFGINATGAVVGGSPSPGAGLETRAFLFRDDLGLLPLFNVSGNHAYDINDAGQITGFTAAGNQHAFRWTDGVVEDLGVLPGYARSFGYAINEVGQVAGSSSTATGNAERVVRYTDGVGLEDLGGGGEFNKGWGINVHGDVVGQGRPGGGLLRAFLYTDAGGLQDLRSLIPHPEDWFLFTATDINDAGQIVVGAFSNVDTKWHALRLDPIPDVTPPVTTESFQGTPGDEGWWRSPVEVTLNASDDSGIASTSYRIDGQAWQNYSAPFSIPEDGTHLLEFYSVDVWGNTEAVRNRILSIDGTPPMTSPSATGTPGEAGWWRSPVEVTLNASDGTSGIRQIAYRIDGGPWDTYLAPFTLGGEGGYLVEYRATDRAGNVEPTESLEIRIDTVPPSLDHAIEGTQGSGGWWLGDVAITLSASEAGSGGTTITYRVDGGPEVAYTSPFTLSGDGDHWVEYSARDAAGNSAASTFSLRIDGTPPEATALLTGILGGAGWYLTPVTVEILATDLPSGVAALRYSLDGGPMTDYTEPLLVDSEGPHIVAFTVEDLSGHVLNGSRRFGIDGTAPTTTISLSGTAGNLGWWVSAVTLTLSATDAVSGVAVTWFAVDGGSPQSYGAASILLPDGRHIVAFWSVDHAGNAEAPRAVEVLVDERPPAAEIETAPAPEPSGWIRGPVDILVSAQDIGSGVASLRYRIDGGAFTEYTGPFRLTADGVHRVEAFPQDVAGNVGPVTPVEVRMDQTPPKITLREPESGRVLATREVLVDSSATDGTSGLATCTVSLDGGPPVASLGPTYTFSGVPDGDHTVRVACTDIAGNTAVAQSTFRVRTATEGPASFGIPPLVLGGIVLAMAAVASALFLLRRRRARGRR